MEKIKINEKNNNNRQIYMGSLDMGWEGEPNQIEFLLIMIDSVSSAIIEIGHVLAHFKRIECENRH